MVTPFKICAISDTHNKWNNLVIPECDLLISAGDYSFRGEKHIVKEFHTWLNKQPAKHIISVQGNHELWVEDNFLEAKQIALEACPKVHFMDEGLVEIEGIKIWCSAITPEFCNWAWNVNRGDDIKKHWDRIPKDTQILVTHGPPYQILDYAPKCGNVGCEDLFTRVLELKDLKVHFFGHIHHSYGQKEFNSIKFFNVSNCNESYQSVNPVTIIDYE